MADPFIELATQSHYIADGSQHVWPFSFADGYISTDYVKAYTEDTATGERTQLTVTAVDFVTPTSLDITVASGLKLVIYRDTPKTLRLVDYADGDRVTEGTLDLANKQCIHICMEVLDGARVDFAGDDVGFRSLRLVTYSGASTVLDSDGGKAHYKTDGSGVLFPDTLPAGHLVSVINDSDDTMLLTFDGTAYPQGAVDSGSAWNLFARQVATVHTIASGKWMISGFISKD